MVEDQLKVLFNRLGEGRTDLVFNLLELGVAADFRDQNGVSLMEQCAYYGDVSAIRLLMARGAALSMLGEDLGLGGASYHGHWRLCEFLIEQGADVNQAAEDTGETALHNGGVETIQMLKKAGAVLDVKDANGETPLSWASWYGRPNPILRELLYGDFRIHPQNQSMRTNLVGKPLA